MSLKEKINSGVKEAMKAKDQDRLRTLRAIKSAIMLVETESGAKSELTSDDEMKLLLKLAKQRKDSAAIFIEQNRKFIRIFYRNIKQRIKFLLFIWF